MIALAALALAPLGGLARLAAHSDAEIWAHLAAYVLPPALANTLLLLGGVAAVTAVVGVGTAWIVTAFEFPGRAALIWLLPLPLALPTYIVAYVYVDILDTLGPVQRALRATLGWSAEFLNVRSLGGAVLVMGFVLYPYVYLGARAMFQTQSAATVEMARIFGAGKWRLARDITLPLARPAIAAGLTLALLETLNDIGASEYLGVHTLTLSIFTTWLNRGSLPGAAQIACLMLVAVAALLAVERLGWRRRAFTGLDQQARTPRAVLSRRGRWLATAACLVPVTFGFLVPAGFLASEVVARGLLVGFDSALVRHAATTVALAAVATTLTIAFGFGAAVAVRLVRDPLAAACVATAGLGYALPGTVLALGLLSPVIAVDEAVNALVERIAGRDVGLVIMGSGAAIVVAYVIRFLSIAIGFGQAGFARISHDLDDAARTTGARAAGMIWTIHLPLARPALWGAALLVFVDCLKELPATLLLRPLNVETLSTYVYQFATRGSFEEGALAALLIVAVGIPAVMRMVRYADDALHVAVTSPPEPQR